MTKVLRVTACSLICIATWGSAFAQSPVLTEMYGRGVHQYFSHDLTSAFDTLSAVIDAGSDDPRAYYFRGLVHAASGRDAEAKSDWETAAQMEIGSPKQGMVGQSLQRVQGSTRLQLEEVRQTVRLQQRNAVAAQNRARYEELKQVEPQVLRNTGATPRAPAASSAVAPAPTAVNNPFQANAPAAPAPTVVAEDGLKNPFADDAGAPAGSAPAPATAPTADPFGGAAPAADPFGAGAAPAADPFGGAAPAADPFGGAAPAADPFGAAAPAPADPFAN